MRKRERRIQESESTEHQVTNNDENTSGGVTNGLRNEGVEGDEFRSSAVPNTRRRIATTTSLEENKSDERTVAVTIQESLDGIREKAMRIARRRTGTRKSMRL